MQNKTENIDFEIIGKNYEQSLNNIVRKNEGIFFTPTYITKYICENTIGELCKNKQKDLNFNELTENKLFDYKNWLLTLKILDPACGNGIFLNQALDFLINEHKKIDEYFLKFTNKKYNFSVSEILKNNIFGVDLDNESVSITKYYLNLKINKPENNFCDLSGNIKCGNSLIDSSEIAGEKAFVWEKEFPEIMKNGGFDCVVGNPPYGAELSKEHKNYLDSKFIDHKSGTKNSAIYFIYQASILLKRAGINSFIIPKSICYSYGWYNCANFLIPKLTKLIDTGKAFKDVLLEQVIYIFNQNSNQNYYKTGICQIGKVVELQNIDKTIFSNFNVLIAGNTIQEISLIEKISQNSNKYSDFVSIERGLNWQSKVPEKKGNIPIYRGAQLDRYYLNKATDFIDVSEFNEKDYAYQLCPKVLNQLAIAHVLNPFPHFYLQSFLDTENRLVFETISCTFAKYKEIDMYFLLGLNNSKLFAWILYKFIYSNAVRSTRFDEKYVGKIPVPDFLKLDTKAISENVKRIIEIYNNIYKKENEFLQILVSNFTKIKLTNNLKSFYNFDFNSFIEEFKKQKIELNLTKQKEWLSFFNEYKSEINQLQIIQNQTNKAIDSHIYQLYNLTEEEISIIENEQ